MSKGTYMGLWIPKAMLHELDILVDEGYFRNRSEAIRAAVASMILILKPYIRTSDINLKPRSKAKIMEP
jgi:hypothetical protein